MPREWGSWSGTSSSGARYRVGFDWSRSGTTVTVSRYVFESEFSIYKDVTLTRTGDLSGSYSVDVGTSGGVVSLGHGGSASASRGGSVTIGARVTNILHGLTCSVSERISIPADVPGTVEEPFTNPQSTTSVYVSWLQPDTNGSAIDQYQIRIERGGSLIQSRNQGGGDRNHTFTGLAPNTRYGARVRARNAAGWGGWSPFAYFYTDARVPAVPSRPSVSNIQDDRATVTWSAPNDYNAPIDNYKVVLHENGSFDRSYETSGRSVVWGGINPLKPNTEYRSAVNAHNSAGWSGYSNYVNWRTDATAPSAPRSLDISQVESTSFRFSWAAPSQDGGLGIKGYRVQVATDSSFSNLVYNSYIASTSRVRSITGLDPDTRYYARVRAANSAYNGPYSGWVSTTTDIGVPSAPLNLRVLEKGATTVLVGWDPPTDAGGGSIDHYQVSRNGQLFQVTDLDAYFTHLDPGTENYVNVRAHNTAGYGPWHGRLYFTLLSGVRIGDGSTWRDAVIHVGDGTAWRDAVPYVGDGSDWRG